MPEFGRACLVLIAHAPHHKANHLLYARAQPFVERLLQFADSLEAGMFAFHPAAHVENFQMAYAALAVPQQFCHVFHAQALGGEHQPVTGIQLGQFAGQLAH